MAIIFSTNTGTSPYQSKLVVVDNGFVYIGNPPPNSTLALCSGQSSALLQSQVPVSMAYLGQHVYIVDGVTIVDVAVTANSVSVLTASTGTLPAGCTLACNWRDRLILSGSQTNPQNLYASRVGNPRDYNYAATDTAAAFVIDEASGGRIGEPVTALIPYTDDYFILGCSHSMFMFEGDPAANGVIVRISDNMGVVGKDAWCLSPDGDLYYIGTGGLFSVKPIFEQYRPPENLTKDKYNQYFQNLDPGSQFISLVWDADLHYLYMFATPVDGQTVGTHLLFDQRNGGLWPLQFPASQGPACSCLYLGLNSPNIRSVLLGGWDGFIRRFSFNGNMLDDDGTAITSSITLGPISPFPEAAALVSTTIDLGEIRAGDHFATTPPLGTDTYTGDGSRQFFPFVLSGGFDLTVTINGTILDPSLYQNQIGNGVFINNTAPAVGAIVVLTGSATLPPQDISQWGATALITSGPDAYTVTEGTARNFFSVPMTLDRRQKTFRQRLSGRWFTVTLKNAVDNQYFSFESVTLEFDQAGMQRTLR